VNPLDQWLVDLLQAQMAEHDLTISDVARMAGISRQHASNILLGIRSPSTTVWAQILEAVGYRFDSESQSEP
jgi:transcriptional regulator with XRE-family HTH domain